jgi:hypothetical protein
VPATLDQVRPDASVTGRAVPNRCPAPRRRATVPWVEGTDGLLATRLMAGDDHALTEIFDSLAPAVYGAALRVLGQGTA